MLVEKALLSSAAALGVPEKAETVDAIFCPYRRKKKALRASSGTAPHLNRPFRVFCADGALCFADAFQRLSLPLEDLTALRRVNRRLCVLGWNKDVPYNKGVYKPYQITVNSAGLIFFKPYYVLTLTSFGREFELWIPPYDLPAVQSVLESGGRSLPV